MEESKSWRKVNDHLPLKDSSQVVGQGRAGREKNRLTPKKQVDQESPVPGWKMRARSMGNR